MGADESGCGAKFGRSENASRIDLIFGYKINEKREALALPRPARVHIEWCPEIDALVQELSRRKDVKIKAIDRFYKPEEVAEALKVHVRTVGRWTEAGLIAHIKVGANGGKATIRYAASAIEQFVRRFTIRSIEDDFSSNPNGR